MNQPEIPDYRKLALEAAMKIPYQTHSELLTSCDRIYNWLVQDRKEDTSETLFPYDPISPYHSSFANFINSDNSECQLKTNT